MTKPDTRPHSITRSSSPNLRQRAEPFSAARWNELLARRRRHGYEP